MTDLLFAVDPIFATLAHHSREAVVLTDESGLVLYANPCASQLLGVTIEVGDSFQAKMRSAAAEPVGVSNPSPAGGEPGAPPGGGHIELANGAHAFWSIHESSAAPGSRLHRVSLTAPARPMQEPPVWDLMHQSYDRAPVGLFLADLDLNFIQLNIACVRILDSTRRELLRRGAWHYLRDHVEPDELRQVPVQGRTGRTMSVEAPISTTAGATRWTTWTFWQVCDAGGQPAYFAGLIEDTTDRRAQTVLAREENERLSTLATMDQKTGLYNYAFMQQFLSRRLAEARRTGQCLSVLMLDIDRFRRINAIHGHDSGDLALLAMSGLLREALREEDVACRFGGEEFALVLAGADGDSALRVAERIRHRLSQLRPIPGRRSPITCSVGLASFPEHASTAASLIKAADMALFDAKRGGRNRVAVYSVRRPVHDLPQVDEIEKTLRGATPEAVQALITAIDLRDRYTGAHCQRVRQIALRIADRLEMSSAEVDLIDAAAPLLDVGKIALPDSILVNPGCLSPSEWEMVRRHPEWGEQLLRGTSLAEEAVEVVRWHHERLDGSGYPDGLTADEQPPVLRLIHVADVAAALRDDRPHRAAWTMREVHSYLQDAAGSILDTRMISAYRDCFPV